MIVVRVELWRFGNPEDKRILGELRIANDGTGTPECGNYRAALYGKGQRQMGPVRELHNWARKRRHVWDLVLAILQLMRRRP